MKNKKKIDPEDMISIIKGTVRGKIAVFLLIVGVLSFLGNISAGFGGALFRLLVFIGLAYYFIASAYSSIIEKEKKLGLQREEAMLNQVKESATKCVGDYLYVNEDTKTWCVPSVGSKEYSFSDLLDFDLVENGDIVAEGSLSGTIVGAMTGGFTGALLGATTSKASDICKSLVIKISVNDMNNPLLYITFIDSDTKKSWPMYEKAASAAQEVAAVLNVIKARNGR